MIDINQMIDDSLADLDAEESMILMEPEPIQLDPDMTVQMPLFQQVRCRIKQLFS